MWIYIAAIVTLLTGGMVPSAVASGSRPETIEEARQEIQETREELDRAEKGYQAAVLQYGKSSREAQEALNNISRLQTQIRMDEQRLQDAQAIHSAPAPTR